MKLHSNAGEMVKGNNVGRTNILKHAENIVFSRTGRRYCVGTRRSSKKEHSPLEGATANLSLMTCSTQSSRKEV